MPVNPDGTLRPYTDDEIASWNLGTRGIDDGSNPEERYSPNGSGCTRRWLCNWGNRFDVITHLLGQVVKYINEAGQLQLSRQAPQLHPDRGWACISARITGHKFIEDHDPDGTGGNIIPVWDAAEIEATYEQYPVNSLAADGTILSEIERYVSEPGHIDAVAEPSAEYLSLPGGILKYKTSDGSVPHDKQIQSNVGFTIPQQIVYAVWRRLPPSIYKPATPLWQRVQGAPLSGTLPWIGSVNSTPIFDRPALTMLLLDVEEKIFPDPTGEGSGEQLELRFRWLFRAQTHVALYYFDPQGTANKYYQISKAGVAYKDPTTFADNETIFPLRDHNTLFNVN